jgi:DNA polymerase III subunit delta
VTASPPVIYLLHGEDEFGIAQFVAELKARLGDPSLADMNTTVLDGRSASFNELVTATSAVPFLAPRRLVVLTYPLARFSNEPARGKFLEHLERIPPSTALVLVEHRPLTDEALRKKKKIHWLEEWAQKAGGGRVYLRSFSILAGGAMAEWIQKRAVELGGKFTYPAASLLASLVGSDVRMADQEIQKLLAYTNFSRPVEAEDVDLLTPSTGMGNIFTLVDALGNRNGQQALKMFHHLLAEQDVLQIFGMVVRQFRLLLLAREVLESGGDVADITNQLGGEAFRVQPFLAKKLASQARKFSLPALESIYRRLLEMDVASKSGEMEAGLAIDTLIAELTA